MNMHTEYNHFLYYKVDDGGDNSFYARIGIMQATKPMKGETKDLAIQDGREALAKLTGIDIEHITPVTKEEYDANADDDEEYDDDCDYGDEEDDGT